MAVEDTDEILAALGVEDEEVFGTAESRYERRLLSALVDARRDDVDYWRLFELTERFQRAAIRASFARGEFGPDHVDVGEETVQYSQRVHATARARAAGAPERRLLVNLAGAYRLFEDEWSGER
ncbi:hypothetical protein [Haladaptatus salinisoli]|uniref:hypothetical protein n=1 Tax=Haladaptatus salinisoli TaxID=2884876 RepID=UPI001D0B8CB1|nr:hypothetical protein [Haladaptatus salinisoli]